MNLIRIDYFKLFHPPKQHGLLVLILNQLSKKIGILGKDSVTDIDF